MHWEAADSRCTRSIQAAELSPVDRSSLQTHSLPRDRGHRPIMCSLAAYYAGALHCLASVPFEPALSTEQVRSLFGSISARQRQWRRLPASAGTIAASVPASGTDSKTCRRVQPGRRPLQPHRSLQPRRRRRSRCHPFLFLSQDISDAA